MPGRRATAVAVLALLAFACAREVTPPAPDGCTRQTCASLGVVCGKAYDGCGTELDCGACEIPIPDAGPGCDKHPITCAERGNNCGRIIDGCGGIVVCGTCVAPDVCGAMGVPNVCSRCVPESDVDFCGRYSANCGTFSALDNCQRLRSASCGSCLAPDSCGGGGVFNRCGCTAPSDAALCGTGCSAISVTDVCNRTRNIQCAGCIAPGTCGGGGVANQCGCQPSSDAALCADAGASCGPVWANDDCSGLRTVTCGSCMAPATCGGAGVPRQCGVYVCTPKPDAELCGPTRDCGPLLLTDDCGVTRTVDCGICAAPRTCGGGGVPNACSPDPLCITDQAPPDAGGFVTIGPSFGGVVALCSGEVLVGNNLTNRVNAFDVITGFQRGSYQLNASPRRMVLDPSTGRLHVALGNAASVATINLLDGGVSYLPLTAPANDLTLAGSGLLLAAIGTTNPGMAIIDTQANVVSRIIPLAGGVTDLIACNPAASQVVMAEVGGYGTGYVQRYALDSSALTLSLLETVSLGTNCGALAISPDGLHLAYSCGHGNGTGYDTFDFVPTDLSLSQGSWMVGAYPSGGRFSTDSQLMISANATTGLFIFDVTTHAQLAAHTASPNTFCSYGGLYGTAISPGKRFVYGFTNCGFNFTSGQLYWWPNP